MLAQGNNPEVFCGCAGSFDDRAKKITKAFVRILIVQRSSAIWYRRELFCDPAKELEMSSCFQMQAMMNSL
jgi:hypothetical protein